jgi:DNA-binding Lrp family transcriptional regulator
MADSILLEQVIRYLARHATIEYGRSQAEIAVALNVSQSTISRLLKANPNIFKFANKGQITRARTYYWDSSSMALTQRVTLAPATNESSPALPPGTFDIEQFNRIMGRAPIDLHQLMLDAAPAVAAVLGDSVFNARTLINDCRSFRNSGGDLPKADLDNFVEAAKRLPEVITYLVALHAITVRSRELKTGEAWKFFYSEGELKWPETNS